MGSLCGSCKAKKINKQIEKPKSFIEKFENVKPIPGLYSFYIESECLKPSKFLKKQEKKDFLKIPITSQTSPDEPITFEFVDNIFEPKLSSIMSDLDFSTFSKQEDIDFLNSIVWRKPKDIFKNDEYDLFKEIEVEDILQGILGDCYFLCAVSAMARYPNRIINKILLDNERTIEGTYTVRFYLQGKEKLVYLDDYFPVTSNNDKWAYCWTVQNEIWVQLLEKAWAKINGTYYSIASGTPYEALSCLTPAPVFTYCNNLYSDNDLWQILKTADEMKYIVCATSGESNEGEFRGIVRNHGYTILKIYEVGSLKLLRIRNPWGGFEWTGAYSDNSPLWTDELKLITDYSCKNEGIFFMTVEDYKKYFLFSFVCKYEDDYIYEYKKFTQKTENGITCVKLNFSNYYSNRSQFYEENRIFICLHSKQSRFYRRKKPTYKQEVGTLIFFKKHKKSNEITYIHSEFNNEEKILLETTVPNSSNFNDFDYYILTSLYWPFKDKLFNPVISSYSRVKIEMEQVVNNELPKDYLLHLLSSYLVEKAIKSATIFADDLKIKDAKLTFTTNLDIYNNLGFVISKIKNESEFSIVVIIKIEYNKEKLVFLPESGFIEVPKKEDERLTTFQTILYSKQEKLIVFKMLDKKKNCIIDFEDVLCKIVKEK